RSDRSIVCAVPSAGTSGVFASHIALASDSGLAGRCVVSRRGADAPPRPPRKDRIMSIFGRSRRAFRLLPGLLFGALIAAAPLAGAQTPPSPFPGLYRIGIDATGAAPSAGQCLIRGDSGNGNFIRHLWTEMPNGKSRW